MSMNHVMGVFALFLSSLGGSVAQAGEIYFTVGLGTQGRATHHITVRPNQRYTYRWRAQGVSNLRGYAQVDSGNYDACDGAHVFEQNWPEGDRELALVKTISAKSPDCQVGATYRLTLRGFDDDYGFQHEESVYVTIVR